MQVIKSESLNNILETVPIEKGMTCFVGSGGKTSLIRAIAYELAKTNKVIVSTSTKMNLPEEMPFIEGSIEPIRESLSKRNAVCVGTIISEEKIAAPKVPFHELLDLADFILVEADGAKHFPLKIPNKTEPVYPNETTGIVCVAGLSGNKKTFRNVCFRKERISSVLNKKEDDLVNTKDIATLIGGEKGVLWNAPVYVPISVVLNQADGEQERDAGFETISHLDNNSIISASVLSLKYDFGGKYARFC